jgi:myo-inositol-1(or 4)-monophosphatase
MWCDTSVTTSATTGATTSARELGRYAEFLARGAADLIRRTDHRREGADLDMDIQSKSTSTDLVTVVDQASETWLIEQITRDRPGDGILGEEGGERAGTTGVRWVVDPIDGTVNFVLGLPAFSVSVAAELDGTVVAGAVCNPVSDELFHATAGGGAWLGDQRLTGPRDVALDRAVVGTGFAYDRELRRRQAVVAAALLPRVADIRRMGSAALDLCSVAAGRLDAYYETGLNPWDYGAGALIAAEAGCVVGGLHGAHLSARVAVAAGPGLAGAFAALLEELGADAVAD